MPPVYISPSDPNSGRDPSGYADVEPAMQKLMRRYAQRPRGRNVFLMVDGSVTETQPASWDPSNPSGPVSQGYNPFTNTTDSTTLPTSQQVQRIFWGGTDNPVSTAEAATLTAAGYGAYLF